MVAPEKDNDGHFTRSFLDSSRVCFCLRTVLRSLFLSVTRAESSFDHALIEASEIYAQERSSEPGEVGARSEPFCESDGGAKNEEHVNFISTAIVFSKVCAGQTRRDHPPNQGCWYKWKRGRAVSASAKAIATMILIAESV